MRFEWDEDKRAATLRNRGLDFADAPEVDWRRAVFQRDDRADYGEERWQVLAPLRGRLIAIVLVYRDGVRRIISMRKANTREQRIYAERIGGGAS